MKTLLVVGLLCSICATQTYAQEQRVTAKIKKQNAEHNAALEKGIAPPTDAAKPAVSAPKKELITDLPTAEKVVKYQVNVVKQAKLRSDQAKKTRDGFQMTAQKNASDSAIQQNMEKEVAASEKALTTARGAFDILFDRYQKLGGTTDYRSQLPQ